MANFLSGLPPANADKRVVCRDLTHQVTRKYQLPFARGGFADIYEGEWTSPSSLVAIKCLRGADTDPQMSILRRLHHEVGLWNSLSHENVLPILGICADKSVWPAIISPFCKYGHVLEYLVTHPGVDRLQILSYWYIC